MRAVLLALGAIALAAPAGARTWVVGPPPADASTINAAIAAAAPGDTILVKPGEYHEEIVLDKRLAIIGEDHPAIVGTGRGTVIVIHAAGSEVRGLTIAGTGTGGTNGMDAGIHVMSDGNRVVDNRMHQVFYGIVVANATGNEVTGNEISGLADRPFGRRGDGIYLYRAHANVVARNHVRDQRDAIYLQYASGCRILDNVISGARYGLHDMFSDDTLIAGNTFSGSSAGANIMNSRRVALSNNRFLRNTGASGVGLTFKDSDDSAVRGNVIAGNPRGLLLDGSSSNRFLENEFTTNDTAIRILASAERNVFTGNRFVDNWSDVVVSGTDPSTKWSADGRGNYWSRYRGFDFDGDGVGDAPHAPIGAFEALEGETPAVRIFLRSPAAAGLELAASLAGRATGRATDAYPLIARRAPARGKSSGSPPFPVRPFAATGLFAAVIAAATLALGKNPC